MTRRLLTAMLALALTLAAVGCGSGSGQSAAPVDFYKGKTIDLVICARPGGDSDLIGRVIASYLERDTGAAVQVTNMRGAGGLEGMNYVYRSEPDGLTLGLVSSVKFVGNEVLDEPAAEYDIQEFSYLLKVGHAPYYLFTSPDGDYQSVADLQAGENLLLAGASPSGPVSLGGLSIVELLDLSARVITGFEGETDRALAVKRGEVIGYACNIPTAKASMDSGLVEPMFLLGTARDPVMPDVPAITELCELAPEELDLVELWSTALVGCELFMAPPGVSEDKEAFLRGLAAEWIQEEDFREEMSRVSGYEVSGYATGDAVAESMLNVAAAMDDFQAIFQEMIEKYRA